MNGSQRVSAAWLPWLFPLALVVLIVAATFAPGWLMGLVGLIAFLVLGYGGVAWYCRRYQQFHAHDTER